MKTLISIWVALMILSVPGAHGAGWLDRLGFGGKTTNRHSEIAALGLSQDQMIGGLKEALGQDAGNLDAYVTRKALDGLVVKIAEEEVRIRENPAALSTVLMREVFGAYQK